ncbi:MAG: vitamin K epoxide reductase [Oscillochloris sp.]|nr:vitamin K epoxide reductase [Oscillochloris sp.]
MSHTPRGPLALIISLFTLLFIMTSVSPARAAGPVAHAVLFYSPTCPHCHIVMEQVLPPLQEHYGEQLAIVNIDVTQSDGQALYQAAISAFAIGQDRLGVPTMIFGQDVMVGEQEIPSRLPALIVAALSAGGNSWPAIPGLDEWMRTQTSSSGNSEPVVQQSAFKRDPLGSGLALTLLLVMVGSAVAVLINLRPPFDRELPTWRERAILGISIVGLIVAGYLSFVELSGSAAVCGPVGDCNAVQQSPYARLFGVLPIGLLGIAGYLAIIAALIVQRQRGQIGDLAANALPVFAFLGVVFSIYLTFLEPFVIGAVCMWCLSSAVLMTALLWVSAPRPAPQIRRGKGRRAGAH